MTKPIALPIALAALMFFSIQIRGAEPFPWEAFNRSSVGYYIFNSTPEGRALFERITSLSPRPSRNLDLVRRGLEEPHFRESFKPEIETRLERIRSRFGESADFLSPSDQIKLNQLAAEELNLSGEQRDGQQGSYADAATAFVAEIPLDPAANALRELQSQQLAPRVSEFVQTWSDRARIVEDVVFTLPHEQIPTRARRRVLVVSRNGLNEEQLKLLQADYLRTFAPETISFPLKEAGTHLFLRIGPDVLDYNVSMRNRPHALGSSAQLEPVVLLTADELSRARIYAKNAFENSRDVLGVFAIDGVASGRTEGRLNMNRGIKGELHNCTSWICTAPVGVRGASLLKLVGAKPEWEVHTNPGWWNNFLITAASPERVPLVIYWSDEPLPALLEKVRPGQPFVEWNFKRR